VQFEKVVKRLPQISVRAQLVRRFNALNDEQLQQLLLRTNAFGTMTHVT
jgi:hypothetical protein